MSVVDQLIIRMRTVGASTAASEIGVAERGIRGLGSTAKQVAGAAGLAGLAFGIKDITEAAISFQQQQDQLANALRDTGQYSAAAMHHITEAADTLSTHGGLDPTTTLSGIQQLIRAHDSVSQALRDEHLATDLVRAKNLSYTTAIRTLSNVEQGRTTGLSRLALNIHPVTTAEDALARARLNSANALTMLTAEGMHLTAAQRAQYQLNHQITPQMVEQAKLQDQQATKVQALRMLWEKYGGAVEAFSHGPEGAISNFRHTVDILAQHLGKVLTPAITAVANGMAWTARAALNVLTFFQKDHDAALALEVALGVLTTLFVGWAVSAGSATVATWGLVAATAALSAALPILFIAGLVLAIVELIKHWGDLKAAALDAWHWIEQAASDAWTWLKGVGTSIAHFFAGIWGSVRGAGVSAWHWITGAATDFWNWIKGAGNAILQAIEWPFLQAFKVIKWIYDHTIGPIVDAITSIVGGGSSPGPGYQVVGHVAASDARAAHVALYGARAFGGPIGQSGWYTVGEQGREDVFLPAGSYVAPHSRSDASEPLQLELKIPIENKLSIGPYEFYKGMNYAMAKVKATR